MIEESLSSQTGFLHPTLTAGLQLIAQDAELTFTKYRQFILPADGFIFWLKTSQSVTAKGSLHYSTDSMQESDEVFDKNSMIFTSETDIDDFNVENSTDMLIGSYNGIRFAFSTRSSLYAESGLYHYSGDAIYPALQTQIIDEPEKFDYESIIVSNSLPIWLSLRSNIPIYPAYLSVQNKEPVYSTCEVLPATQVSLQSAPWIDSRGKHWQLVSEKVRFHIYGARNQAALGFQDFILAAPPASGLWGIMDMPIMVDQIRTQPEITAIAMKKTFEITVNYYQQDVMDIARRLIKNAYLQAINNYPLNDPELIPGV